MCLAQGKGDPLLWEGRGHLHRTFFPDASTPQVEPLPQAMPHSMSSVGEVWSICEFTGIVWSRATLEW